MQSPECHRSTTPCRREQHLSRTADPHGIYFHIDAHRSAASLAGLIAETPVVLGAFNDVVHQDPIRQLDLHIRAKDIGREIILVWTAIDHIGLTGKVITSDILLGKVVRTTRINPV